MSDNAAFGFGKFVPGFDFLQSLAKSAGQPSAPGGAMPGMSSWVAPTLSVEELDKRIQELKAVQFWLEQNGTALKATIQALEVQKMTLTTLQGMNVNMAELAKAFTARAPETAPPAAKAPTPQATAQTEAAEAADAPTETPAKPKASRSKAPASDPSGNSATVDPMQWWGSLTQQFQNIASSAMQDVAAQAMKTQEAAAAAPAAAAKAPTRTQSAPTKTPAKKPAAKTRSSNKR